MAGATQDRTRLPFGGLYAEDFDAPPAPPPPPEPPPPPPFVEPVFSAADVDDARAEGRAAGHAEAERGFAASRLHLIGVMTRGLAEAGAAHTAAAEEAAEAVAKVMLSVLAACLPALCARHGVGELQALARAVLPKLVKEPRVSVRVHPMMAAAMEAEIATLDAELADRMVVLPTEQVAPGDARITWQDGAALRETGPVRVAVMDALAGLGLLEKEIADA